MLSTMESEPERPTADEAAAALADADASRAALAGGIALPSWFFASMGAAIATQIATAAIGLGGGAAWALPAGLALFAVVAGVQLARFRRRNGVWLGGLASRVVLGTGTAASAAYVVALGAALWAAYAGTWWLVVACAIAGGAAYAVTGRRWVAAYHAQPAVHGRGEPAAWLAVAGVAALAGLALLLISS